MSTVIAVKAGPLQSLAWAGDDLIDWLSGQRVRLDGTVLLFGTGYPYRFDAATGLDDIGVMFETLGTKGRIARWNGELRTAQYVPIGFDELREIERSYYRATDYAYPACVFVLPDGRPALAHCPKRYDTLEIELLDGTQLTRRSVESEDVFHSRLTAARDGRWLLSNGWVWQPWNVACVYDVERALVDPAHLSSIGLELDLGDDFDGEAAAAVLAGDRVVIAGADDAALSVVELPSGRNLACLKLAEPLGTRLVAWGPDHVVALDGRPRVISLADAAVVEAFEVQTGSWDQPSVNLEPPKAPFVAIDPRGSRFAVGTADGDIVVIAR